ncbi:MAG TPA: hypothetical protein VK148_05045 [Xanthobacteraceae bacterium]|jgi:hypothetical protein|nr:hypothetical protein [Xanthobacteraceae bacterium]
MTIRDLNNRHHNWHDIIDYETFWILCFAAAVVGSGMFALFSIAQMGPIVLP